MKIHELIRDYFNATKSAAPAFGGKWHSALYSVIKARLNYGVGPWNYSLFRFGYIKETDWPSYMIDSRDRLLPKFSTAERRSTVVNKFTFLHHCRKHNLTTIPIPAFIDQLEKDSPLNCIDLDAWLRQISKAPDQLFIKLIDGTLGLDSFKAVRTDIDKWSYCGRSGTSKDLHSFLLERLGNP